VDEIAQRILPSATSVELPAPGMEVHRGDPVAVVRPHDDGWRSLPGAGLAEAWLAAERRRLALVVEEQLGMAAADGGELIEPAPALLGEDGWRRVVATFLHAA